MSNTEKLIPVLFYMKGEIPQLYESTAEWELFRLPSGGDW